MFTLGSSTWRIDDITPDRVLVTPGARACRAGCRSGRATPRAGPRSSARRWAPGCASSARCPTTTPAARVEAAGLDAWAADNLLDVPARAARGDGRGARRTPCSWSSGSATSSATGGWSCTPPTARACTRRGRSSSARGCASGTAWTPRRCTRTTGSSCGCRTCSTPATARWSTTRGRSPTGPAIDLADLLLDPDEVLDAVQGRARLVGDVRRAVPRGREPRAAAPPPPAGPPPAALAAAAAVGAAAVRGVRVPRLPDPARGRPRVPPGRLRHRGAHHPHAGRRGAPGPGRRGDDDAAVALRAVPAVRLHRAVPLRRRRPAGRAPRRCPDARPDPAGRAARPGRRVPARRPARPRGRGAHRGGAERTGARAAGRHARAAGRRRPAARAAAPRRRSPSATQPEVARPGPGLAGRARGRASR